MYYKTTSLLLCAMIFFVGCNEETKEKTMQEPIKVVEKAAVVVKIAPQEVVKEIIVKKDYTIDEIYSSMCVECHSADGSGNTEKLTPSMADLSQEEMEAALLEVENDDGHVIMEHNRGKILKMGMEYSAKDMSKYMFEEFNK